MTRKRAQGGGRVAHRVDRAVVTARSSWPGLRATRTALREHRRRNIRLYRGGGWGLVVLVSAFALIQVAFIVAGRMDALRLSGTAQVQIVAASVSAGSWYEQSPAGTHLRYTYVVDGTLYSGADFRRWIDVGAHRPKVCYDPANPARHALAEGGYQCGSG